MRRYNRVQMVFTFIAIIFVLIFGIIAVLLSPRIITSKMRFNLRDDNLNVSITAMADDTEFTTTAGTSGVRQPEWSMPNIKFTEEKLTAQLKIIVKNENSSSDVRLEISGIACDQYPDNPRFKTFVTCKIGDKTPVDKEEIKDTDRIVGCYSYDEIIIPKKSEDLISQAEIVIDYELCRQNSSFDTIEQEIVVTMESCQNGGEHDGNN